MPAPKGDHPSSDLFDTIPSASELKARIEATDNEIAETVASQVIGKIVQVLDSFKKAIPNSQPFQISGFGIEALDIFLASETYSTLVTKLKNEKQWNLSIARTEEILECTITPAIPDGPTLRTYEKPPSGRPGML